MLPGVVRDKKESVEDEASCIVDPAVRGDGTMTSLAGGNVGDRNVYTSLKNLLRVQESRDPPNRFLANTNKSPIDPISRSFERGGHEIPEKPQMVQ